MNICQEHARENDLIFSTDIDPIKSKTICIAFNCSNREDLAKIYLNNDPLPWKSASKHIGNMLSEDGTMNCDLNIKRAIFINECMNLNNEFNFIRPEEQFSLLKLYNSHFTGSSCWNFDSSKFQQLVNSWNIHLHFIFGLPYATHYHLVNELTHGDHMKKMIFGRYIIL